VAGEDSIPDVEGCNFEFKTQDGYIRIKGITLQFSDDCNHCKKTFHKKTMVYRVEEEICCVDCITDYLLKLQKYRYGMLDSQRRFLNEDYTNSEKDRMDTARTFIDDEYS